MERSITAGERRIIDGGVANLDLRLARADTVVFLDLPRWLCTWRLIRRHNRGASRTTSVPASGEEGGEARREGRMSG